MRPRRVPKVPTETTLDLNDPQDLGGRLTQIFSEFDVQIGAYDPYDKDFDKPRFIISHKLAHTSWNNITTVVDHPCQNVLLIDYKIDGGGLRFVTAQVLQSLTLGVGALPIDVKDKSPEWLERNAAALRQLLKLTKKTINSLGGVRTSRQTQRPKRSYYTIQTATSAAWDIPTEKKSHF